MAAGGGVGPVTEFDAELALLSDISTTGAGGFDAQEQSNSATTMIAKHEHGIVVRVRTAGCGRQYFMAISAGI